MSGAGDAEAMAHAVRQHKEGKISKAELFVLLAELQQRKQQRQQTVHQSTPPSRTDSLRLTSTDKRGRMAAMLAAQQQPQQPQYSQSPQYYNGTNQPQQQQYQQQQQQQSLPDMMLLKLRNEVAHESSFADQQQQQLQHPGLLQGGTGPLDVQTSSGPYLYDDSSSPSQSQPRRRQHPRGRSAGRTPMSASTLKQQQRQRELQRTPGSASSDDSGYSYGSRSDSSNHTFTPQTKKLPRMYGRSSVLDQTFEQRQQMWRGKRDKNKNRARSELQRKAEEGCTFVPKVNDTTRSMVRDDGVSHQRLFSQRSNTRAKISRLDYARQKEKEIEEACTFQPELSKRSQQLMSGKKARDKRGSRRSGGARAVNTSYTGLEDCTFKPKTNTLNRGMEAAQLYLEQNAFERLSSKVVAPPSGAARADVEASSEQVGREAGSGGGIVPSSAQKQAKVERFLERQRHMQEVKRLNLDRIKQSMDQQAGIGGGSKINAKSRDLMDNPRNVPGEFLARVADSLNKKERLRKKGQESLDPECRFQPEINPYSRSRAGRSAEEMSRGDAVKRAMKLEIARTRQERAELEGATFAPHIRRNKHNARAESVLKINSDPDTFLQRVRERQRMTEQRRKALQEEKGLDEEEECTFRPQIRDAPEYVVSIAESVRQAKAAKAASPPRRADWK